MNLHHLGETRSRRAADHLLQSPDTFVYAPLPGMSNATAVVHVAPALGANFVQYTAVMACGGELAETKHSRFLYVLEGVVELLGEPTAAALQAGGFAYLPPGSPWGVRAGAEGARVAVIEKPYAELARGLQPHALVGVEQDVPAGPLLGDNGIQVRALLGTDPLIDFAVNTMEYQPGARLGMVEVHVMEHGLLMLEGEGIYRLGDRWYPVAAGDFIWMAPFCAQWFAAIGGKPAKYLIYKDWNRHPSQTTGSEVPGAAGDER